MTRTRHDATTLARALAEEVPETLERHGFKRNLCILGTRIATYVLREHGIRARPLPVQLAVMNAAYEQMLNERGEGWEIPTGQAADEYADTWRERGAWVVAIGHGSDGRGWNGHLVVSVADRWLVDTTLGQTRRRQKGIDLPDGWSFEAQQFLRDRADKAMWTTSDGVTLLYTRTLDNSYLTAPDWTHVKADDPLVRAVARKVRPA